MSNYAQRGSRRGRRREKSARGCHAVRFARHRSEHGLYFTLQQTHFFTRDRYAQVEKYSLLTLSCGLAGFLIGKLVTR
jgi:hypothetical protein